MPKGEVAAVKAKAAAAAAGTSGAGAEAGDAPEGGAKKKHRWTDKKKLIKRDGTAADAFSTDPNPDFTGTSSTSTSSGSGTGINARLISAAGLKKTGAEKVKGMNRLARRAAERAAAAAATQAAAQAAEAWGQSSSRGERAERAKKAGREHKEPYTNSQGEAPWWRRAKQRPGK